MDKHLVTLTFAIASDAPVGALIAAWSGKLSRIYHWDVEHDVFTPGQFIKARAEVLTISPGGKYVAYYAEAHHRREQAYVAVSHVPYFTAHAFFKQFSCGPRLAHFVSAKKLRVLTECHDLPFVTGFDQIKDRIDIGCPFRIIHYTWSELKSRRIRFINPNMRSILDRARDRQVVQDDFHLVEVKDNGHSRRTIASFPKEKFEEVAPPDWAQTW